MEAWPTFLKEIAGKRFSTNVGWTKTLGTQLSENTNIKNIILNRRNI